MRPRIAIATPMRDHAVMGVHHASCWSFMGDPNVRAMCDQKELRDDDLVRTRSEFVRDFLRRDLDCTHLLFWDADVEGSALALRGMVSCNVDCIGATYPKKLLGPDGKPVECAVYTEGREIAHDGMTAKVPAIGLGFMLLSRRLLQDMADRYWDDLHVVYGDEPTCALFMLEIGKDHRGVRRQFPEDYSFCRRVTAMRCDVHLYVGPGGPLAHQGTHVYRMRREDAYPSTST